jgi:hypothetical protein
MTASSLPSRENGLLAEGLDAYPNLKAIIEGRIAGNFREWPAVRGELERLLMDQAELMRKASDALQSYRLASSETASVKVPDTCAVVTKATLLKWADKLRHRQEDEQVSIDMVEYHMRQIAKDGGVTGDWP